MLVNSYRAFKQTFGIYLFVNFLSLWNWRELTFNGLNQASENPSLFWNFIMDYHLSGVILSSLIISSLFITFNRYLRWASLWILINWVIIYSFLPFIFSPPNGAYVGWLLLWVACFPHLEELSTEQKIGWWWVLCLGYFISGLGKLRSSYWIDGSAFEYLLLSPLGKDFTHQIIQFSWVTHFLTYGALILELGSITLIFHKYSRKILWWTFLFMHLFVVLCLNIPEVGLLFLIINLALWED